MEVSVDRFGRVLIPKSVRDRLGLGPASRLVLEADQHSITLEPAVPTAQLERNADGLLVLHGALDTPDIEPVAFSRLSRARHLSKGE